MRPFSLSCVFEVCSGLSSGLDMRGKPVRYGAKVRLKHRGTDQWLTLNPEVRQRKLAPRTLAARRPPLARGLLAA